MKDRVLGILEGFSNLLESNTVRTEFSKSKSNHNKKVVVITGASAGVGRATARAFGREGACVGLIARDEERLNATKVEIEQLGGRAMVLPADVSDFSLIEDAAQRMETEFGPIDIWINNAMATVFAPFDKLTAEEFKRATEVTYLGCVYGTMAALKRMKPRDHGVIVQVGSALAHRSIPLQSPYCGAKHAILGFTDSLRSELIHDGCNVWITVVNLPALNTPQFEWSRTRMPRHPQPVPPIFQPEVAADAILWAAQHRRREVDVGFSTIKAVVAQKIVPGFADRYLAATGYESQQTAESVPPNRPDNLFVPVPGEFAAHGRFDSQARSASFQFSIKKQVRALAFAAPVIIGLGLTVWKLAMKRSSHRGRARGPKAA
jgi:short-subunit dehydrogenase